MNPVEKAKSVLMPAVRQLIRTAMDAGESPAMAMALLSSAIGTIMHTHFAKHLDFVISVITNDLKDPACIVPEGDLPS